MRTNYPSLGIRNRSRHDYGEWGNGSFTQNTSQREFDRVNSNYDRNEQDSIYNESSDKRRTRYDVDQDEKPTWGRTNNEAYIWENSGRQEHHNTSRWPESNEGLHRGKGPKGYKRTDERIQEDIHDRLTYDNFVDASNIEVSVKAGEVTLTGTVAERSEKRRAEDLAEQVSGVIHLENRLRVDSSFNQSDKNESEHHYKSLIRSHH
ncbi:MAG: BON domain-containing protein [Cyclobacteriaceae bacterium]|nr:BON domain-containing protein [Cyclobacteriaceae bacterium]